MALFKRGEHHHNTETGEQKTYLDKDSITVSKEDRELLEVIGEAIPKTAHEGFTPEQSDELLVANLSGAVGFLSKEGEPNPDTVDLVKLMTSGALSNPADSRRLIEEALASSSQDVNKVVLSVWDDTIALRQEGGMEARNAILAKINANVENTSGKRTKSFIRAFGVGVSYPNPVTGRLHLHGLKDELEN